ncbi:MAG: arginine--tRNA ligase [archaeon]
MKLKVIKILKKALDKEGIIIKGIENLIEIPANIEFGNYSFPCFILSKTLKKNPDKIAIDLKSKIELTKDFEKVEVVGAYINFFVNKGEFAKKVVKEILNKKQDFGKGDNSKIMIEFSQANSHKAFHVGHIRGTSIGESLSRISELFGNKVIRANYQGDTGMHVAKWLWCYSKYHSNEKLKKDEFWISSIYVDAIKRLDKNKRLQIEVEEINRRLDLKIDKELNKLWKKTRQLSLDSLERIYQELNTFFDIYYFESEVEQKGKEIAKELIEKEIAKISEGATIVDLEEYNLGVWVLLRRDWTVLYSAKDLALAKKKFEDNDLDESVYVVANEQDLHMKQLFKTLELMGFENKNKLHHVTYGMVRLPEGKMSSRTGDNILYSNFIKEVTDYAKIRIRERAKKISKKELEKRALIVSIAAIKYSMLKQNPNKNIIFNKQDALNFEGDTGPYILYSYVRANSILKKAKIKKIKLDTSKLEEKEIELVKKLSLFPEAVLKAHNNLNPSVIANYSYQLAQLFNEFYHSCPVIGSDQEKFRLELVKAFKQVLKKSLDLLGIETLEEM